VELRHSFLDRKIARTNSFVVSGSPGQIWLHTNSTLDREDFALQERRQELQFSGYQRASGKPA
jgi:hypothetical protein